MWGACMKNVTRLLEKKLCGNLERNLELSDQFKNGPNNFWADFEQDPYEITMKKSSRTFFQCTCCSYNWTMSACGTGCDPNLGGNTVG
jgi:hypothetical protein